MATLGCLGLQAAERVAPTLPGFVTLESGKDYYLYNTGTGQFLASDGDNNAAASATGMLTTVTATADGVYSLMSASTGRYLYRDNADNIETDREYSEDYCSWTIVAAAGGAYTIQTAPDKNYYDATQYVGIKSGSSKVYPNCTADAGNIEWKLIDGDAGSLYFAQVRLYDALQATDGLGLNVDKFEQIYASASSTADELNEAADVLANSLDVTQNYEFPDWNDYGILLEPSVGWRIESNNSETMEADIDGGQTSVLTATVVVDQDATLCYELNGRGNIQITVDGKEWHTYNSNQISMSGGRVLRQFVELESGKHTIKWIATARDGHRDVFWIADIGVERTPLITVNLLEPGSLGTEILYNVDHIQDVRRLKVIGSMNSEDWRIINMMRTNLFVLDISETDVKEISEKQFSQSNVDDPDFLHTVRLPEGLTSIGNNAFAYCQLYEINFPTTLEKIGRSAFLRTNVTHAVLPARCLDLGTAIFQECILLEEAGLPDALTTIPDAMFQECYVLKTFKLPSKLTEIGLSVFDKCYDTAFDLPESLQTIKSNAFMNTNQNGEKTRLIIPKNVSYIGSNVFKNCNKYTYAELPVAYYDITGDEPLPSSITTIRLNSPTLVIAENSRIIETELRPNITLQVPSFLVNAYKLDEYWYEFGAIEGFDPGEISEWVLNSDLVLGARDRLAGSSSVTINESGSLKINGTDGMAIGSMTAKIDPDNGKYGRMFSNADKVTVADALNIEFRAGSANKWYFLSLPYNVKVSDIAYLNNSPQRAIRYYDGANRAANGATGSWKDFGADDIIPAGTGFIFQVSESGWWNIPAQEDDSKQYLSSNKTFVKALAANPSDNASDRGWNLVGNPYQSWYNIHRLNFTAPITVRDGNNYAAYSVIDDDYALAPNQAFFVQCPDGISEISFPLEGRQMTSVIESQNGSKPHGAPAVSAARLLADVTVSNGTETDRTRVVVNEAATAFYDLSSDASKFMTEAADVPQLYSFDAEGNKYAINERPAGNGVVRLGFSTGESGVFTMSLVRNGIGDVLLVDNLRGLTVNLALQDYEFTAEAGTTDTRFELRLAATPTGIDAAGDASLTAVTTTDGGVTVSGFSGSVSVFTAAGAKVYDGSADGGRLDIALAPGAYIVRAGGKAVKVIVM